MTDAVDTTEWYLPGGTDLPRDELKVQLEVYGETILLRGFDGDSAWVRTVSADEIANVFTQHLGFSSGLLPQAAVWWNQGETGQVVALWRPPQVWSGGPATGGVQASRTAPASHAGAGLRLLAGPRRPGSTPQLGRPTDAEQHLFRAPAFNVFRDGRVCPGSHRFPEEVGLIPEVLLPVLLLPYRRFTRDRSKKHARQPALRYGRR